MFMNIGLIWSASFIRARVQKKELNVLPKSCCIHLCVICGIVVGIYLFFVCYASQLFIYFFSVDLVQCDLFHVHRLINDAHHHHRAYVCKCVRIFTSDKYGCLGIITNKLSFSQMIKQKKTRLCWRHRTL